MRNLPPETKVVGIYKITSPSGRIYIGQSWDVEYRIRDYQKLRCKTQPLLYNSLKKYGSDNHKFEVVCQLPIDINQKTLDEYEIFFWKQFIDTGYNMLNLRQPGKGGKHCEQSKKKISISKKGNKNNKPVFKKISQFTLDGKWIADFYSITSAAKILGLKRTAISMCVNGNNKTSGKFIFKVHE